MISLTCRPLGEGSDLVGWWRMHGLKPRNPDELDFLQLNCLRGCELRCSFDSEFSRWQRLTRHMGTSIFFFPSSSSPSSLPFLPFFSFSSESFSSLLFSFSSLLFSFPSESFFSLFFSFCSESYFSSPSTPPIRPAPSFLPFSSCSPSSLLLLSSFSALFLFPFSSSCSPSLPRRKVLRAVS